MARKPRGPVAEIMAALSGRGRRTHSALYWWLADRHDALTRERHGRADWVSATEEFTKLGLTNMDGSPLKPANVRKTWERVCRDQAGKKPPALAPKAAHQTAPAVSPVPSPEFQPGAPVFTDKPATMRSRQPYKPPTED